MMPHDPDVKALLRVAVVWNILIAMNRSSEDFLISSHLMCEEYCRKLPDFETYHHRLDIRNWENKKSFFFGKEQMVKSSFNILLYAYRVKYDMTLYWHVQGKSTPTTHQTKRKNLNIKRSISQFQSWCHKNHHTA